MKIGFFAIGLANLARPELLATAARTAERVGFDTLWTGEHIVFFDEIRSEYPYARSSTAPPVRAAVLSSHLPKPVKPTRSAPKFSSAGKIGQVLSRC